MHRAKNYKKSIILGQYTDRGKKRPDNQDFCGNFPQDTLDFLNEKGLLFIVADGMGGHVAGREASETAVHIIQKEYFSDQDHDISASLRHAFEKANSEIYNRSRYYEHGQKMGTTCTALVITENYGYIAHVGDSRAYYVNRNKIKQLTHDHSHVAEMLRQGILTEKEAETHPERFILYRALGIEKSIEIDIINKIPLHSGDYFILCTDGLVKITDNEIKKFVLAKTPQQACEEIVQLANERGGEDNSTIQVIKINGSSNFGIIKNLKLPRWLVWLSVSIILLFTIILLFNLQHKKERDNSFGSDILNINENIDQSITSQLNAANILFNRGKLDSARIIYQAMLKSNPMQIGAIDGINRIAREYKKRADYFRSTNELLNAIKYYKKTANLLPNDQRITDLIYFCEQKLKSDRLVRNEKPEQRDILASPDSIAHPDFDEAVDLKSDESDTIPGILPLPLNFSLLAPEEYEIKAGSVIFKASPKAKIALSNAEHRDIEIEVMAKNITTNIQGKYGIIFGYKTDDQSYSETFFLYTVNDKGEFLLQRISQAQEEGLLSFPAKEIIHKFQVNKLRVKCLGQMIIIYAENIPVKTWEGKEFIMGKVGIYADPNIQVEFSHFKINSLIP